MPIKAINRGWQGKQTSSFGNFRRLRKPVSTNIVRTGLQIYYDFGDGLSYPNTSTTVTNLAGTTNGTLVNGPTFASTYNGITTFDGVNDYINAGSSVLLSRPFTVSVWVNFLALGNYKTICGQDTTRAQDEAALYFQIELNSAFGAIMYSSTGTRISCLGPAVVTNTWYNYTISVSTTELNLYRNGILVTTTSNTATMATTTGNLLFAAGFFKRFIGDYTNANLGQCLVYNVALEPAQVWQNFEALRSRYGI